ncbi:hypothetical protein ACFQV2_02120 [Actinokineospora soli]|uniref:Uncharacterized protein n=1 Tax=Actinokineospora soli TaxID=1048753 RepID=A0ABW2TFU6_9PSEU
MTDQQNPGQQKNAAGEQKKPGKGCGCLVWVVILLMIGLGVVLGGAEEGWFDSSDNDTTIAAPSGQEAADLVNRLAEAEKAHGICYGWSLRDGSNTVVTEGSSRGTGVLASSCARWVSLDIIVDYAPATSESEDSATIDVSKSDDLVGKIPYSTDLEYMGVTREAAINDPTATIGLGALALPLLMAEQGVVEALPLADPADEPATAISRPGSDFVGNYSGALIALGIIGGIAVLSLIIGLIVRKRGAEAR